jgi:hypothetical protein
VEIFYRANCPNCDYGLVAREPLADDQEFECACCGSVVTTSWTLWEEEEAPAPETPPDEAHASETPPLDTLPPPLPPVPTAPPPLPSFQPAEQAITKRERPMKYVVLQVVLKEKFIGTGSANLTELEEVINRQAAKGYRLHTISTTSSGSKGLLGGDRVQATLVFEELSS